MRTDLAERHQLHVRILGLPRKLQGPTRPALPSDRIISVMGPYDQQEATQVLKLGILDQSGRPGQPATGGGTVGQVLLIVH